MTERRQELTIGLAIVAGIAIGVLVWWLRMPVAMSAAPVSNNGASARLAGAIHAPVLAATHAGTRMVAVGEHGVVLLSDDEGATWRQAQAVPTQALLTDVSFADAQNGWAAGHDGVILHTGDGGEHWALQREDKASDKPLMSIRFSDVSHGLAVGLFGLALRTEDGGATWVPFDLIPGSGDDKHLYAIFGDASALCIAAEAGAIYRSTDAGTTWALVQTSNIGSFWTGAALADGTLLAAGQRGHVFASHDHGASWAEVTSGTQQSLTSIVQTAEGSVQISGLAGTQLTSRDAAKTFEARARPDRLPLTALALDAQGKPRYFGSTGAVAP
jgi:photosystem II stability/assembly factor-like uncharacterized protein